MYIEVYIQFNEAQRMKNEGKKTFNSAWCGGCLYYSLLSGNRKMMQIFMCYDF